MPGNLRTQKKGRRFRTGPVVRRRNLWCAGSDPPREFGICLDSDLIEIEPGQFIVAAQHARVEFTPREGTGRRMVVRYEEGRFDDAGNWVFERIWNGDQTDYGLNFTDRPRLLRVVTATY